MAVETKYLDNRVLVNGNTSSLLKQNNFTNLNEFIQQVVDDSTTDFTSINVDTVNEATANNKVAFPDDIRTDVIAEYTAATGVTVDGVLLKDSTVALADGAVGNLSVKIGADANNGLYGVSDTQLGIAVEGALVGGANTTGLFTGNIAEQVVGNGVTVDSVLLKDGGVSNSGQTIYAGFYTITPQNDIAAGVGGAIAVSNYFTTINTDAGGDAFTLANGTQIGQMKKILLVVDGGGDAVVTPASPFYNGGTTATFNDAGDYLVLLWNGIEWCPIENSGVTVA